MQLKDPARRLSTILVLLVSLGFGAALAQPQVVVSIHPYYDLVQRIAGPDVSVVRLLPPGASPHGFDPTPSSVADVERADLVIVNGGLDAWMLELVPSGDGAPSVLELLPLFEGLEATVAATHDGAEHGGGEDAHEHAETDTEPHDHDDAEGDAHEHAGVNPHIWLDPVLMVDAVGAIADRLAEIDPDRADMYRRNADDLATSLRDLHEELERTMEPVRGAPFIPFHDAWPYFAGRYALDLIVEIEPFPGREPGPRYLAEVVGWLRESNAPAIFAEAQLGDRAARVIAAEANVAVAVLDPIGGVEGRQTYEDLLRYNANTIVDTLDVR